MFSVYANDQLIYFPVEQDLVIISPKLSLEIGKAGSFQFGLPPTHRYYDYLQQLKTIITVEYDGVEIFRGRVLTINRGFNKVRQVMCEGNLAYLVDSVQKGVKYKGTTHALFRQIISNHNKRVEAEKRFTVGQITIDDKDIVITGSSTTADKLNSTKFDYDQIVLDSIVDDWVSTFDYIQDTIIDYCGGYLRTRRVGNTTYIDLLKEYTDTTSQKIEFGRNLIDLMQEVKAEDVYSVLIPLGDDNLTIEKADNVVIVGLDGKRIYKNGDELVDEAAVELYGRIVKTHVFDGVNKANTLLDNGVDLLTEHENMPITITAKAVDMHMVDDSPDAIYIGNRVYINSAPHDLTEYLTCTKIEYDFNNPANNTYTFGNPKQSLTQRFKKDKAKSKKSSRSSAAKAASVGAKAAATDSVEEAQDFAVSNSKKTADEFYDAWINVDKEAGHIDLGALYEKYKNGYTVLKNKVGIDLDAPAGTVDIYSMNTTISDQGEKISQSEARIQTLANSDAAQVKQFADFQTKYTTAHAELVTRATKTETTLSGYASFIDKNRKNIESIAGISATATATKSTLETYAKYIDKNKSGINSIASIKQQATNNGASIESLTNYINPLKKDINAIAKIRQDVSDHASQITSLTSFKTSTTSALTRIQQTASDQGSSISLLTEWHGEDVNAIAQIKATADANGSAILLKADKVTLDTKIAKVNGRLEALEGVFSTLTSDFQIAGSVHVGKFIDVKNEVTAGTRVYAGEKIQSKGAVYAYLTKEVATQDWVKNSLTKIDHNFTFDKDLTVNGSLIINSNISLSKSITQTKGSIDAKSLKENGKAVATQAWVKDQLKNYASSKHRHKIYVYHTHKVTVGGTSYTTSKQSQDNTLTTGEPV